MVRFVARVNASFLLYSVYTPYGGGDPLSPLFNGYRGSSTWVNVATACNSELRMGGAGSELPHMLSWLAYGQLYLVLPYV